MTKDKNKEIATDSTQTKETSTPPESDKNDELDGLFCMLGEDSRIIIKDGQVLIENMSDDLLDLALSLNPNDQELKKRQIQRQAHQVENKD